MEQKKCSKQYLTLYETLLSVATHKYLPSSKAIYFLTLRHLLTKRLGKKNLDLLCLVLCVVTCLPNHHLKEISGFYHSVLESFAFLGCCSVQGQRIGPIFRGQGRTDTLSKNMDGKATYAMQQPRKEKFSSSERFTAHYFLEGIPTTGEGQNLRDVLCSTQDIRQFIVALIVKLLRV